MDVTLFRRITTLSTIPLVIYCSDCLAQAQPATLTPQTESFSDWLSQGSLYGELKTMHFYKEFTGTVENKRTHSFGGELQYRSPEWNGFSFGLGEYMAFNLGMNPDDPENREGYLPSDNTNVLGKAFIRYHNYGFDLKGGRIGLDTPFANEVQGWTMIPALYEGFGGNYSMPFNEDIKLHGYRIYRFKPMSEEHFVKTDTGTPEVDDTSMPGVSSDGFTTFGLRYGRLYGATAEAWYYDFDRRARMAYAGTEIPIQPLKMGQWTPYIGAQYLHEWDADDQLFPYQNIDTDLYSARIGIRSRNHTFYVAATRVPEKEDAFLNGAYFSPYSFGIYNQTPLESGQPLVSMVTSNQPGNTLAARYVYHSDRFLTVLGYTHLDLKDSSGIYYPLPAKNIDAGFMILGYDITERLHAEFEFDYVDSPSAQTGNYHAERLRLVYKFGKEMPEKYH
ncbi:hypothetical protein G163CM_02600 [Pseudocitrobacter corydidari]|uniref:Outer membrane porin, OprD family n=2 Tax=Pseudocitrobacter corydidari TaxID=2891570 RepID=A0ABY3S0L1_9ENTR|nr:hypothetical protein G163CM_02600 [Pseudocitrobacter corydidari]